MNILENITETNIKIEDVTNVCRFCVHNTKNLISITSKVSNSFKEIGPNIIITVSELITKCFDSLEENLVGNSHDTPQFLCDTCLKRFVETYEFRKQCVWAFNYWKTQYNYKIESVEEIERSVSAVSPVTVLLDIKPILSLEEYCVTESTLNNIHKDQLINKNSITRNNNIKRDVKVKTNTFNKIQAETSDTDGNKVTQKLSVRKKPSSRIHKKDINLTQVINEDTISCNNNPPLTVKEKVNEFNKIEANASDNNVNKIIPKVGVRKKPSPRICPYCGIVTTTLRKHMLSHTNSKTQFICDFCGKPFQIKDNLYRHTRIHINVRKYKCKLCTAAYVDATSLRVHMLNHTEERKYECTICNKKFKQSGGLQYHIRTHTLEKKVKCDFCDSLFINNSNKKKHHEIHHLKEYKYQCEFCPQKFNTSSNLSSHRFLRHTKQNPYNCELCELKFIRLFDFNAHKRQHKYNII